MRLVFIFYEVCPINFITEHTNIPLHRKYRILTLLGFAQLTASEVALFNSSFNLFISFLSAASNIACPLAFPANKENIFTNCAGRLIQNFRYMIRVLSYYNDSIILQTFS